MLTKNSQPRASETNILTWHKVESQQFISRVNNVTSSVLVHPLGKVRQQLVDRKIGERGLRCWFHSLPGEIRKFEDTTVAVTHGEALLQ